MSETMRTGLPEHIGVVRADGDMLVYEVADSGAVSMSRVGEAAPIPKDEQTTEMLQAVETDRVKRGLLNTDDRRY